MQPKITKKQEIKEKQEAENNFIVADYEDAIESLNSYDRLFIPTVKKFRSGSAQIIETPYYIYLKSYSTIVAYIDKDAGIFVDVLRYVYGYTATSNQNIAKFRNDYRNFYKRMFTYRDIK